MSTAATTAEAGHETSAGMPQLDFGTFPNQIFWFLLAFFALYVLISRVVAPRIGGILADRQGRIDADLDEARSLKDAAVKAEADYQAALASARADAQKIGAEAKAGVQAEIDAAMARADREIAKHGDAAEKRLKEIRDGADMNVEAVARDTARAIVEAILPGSASAKAVDAAVSAALKG